MTDSHATDKRGDDEKEHEKYNKPQASHHRAHDKESEHKTDNHKSHVRRLSFDDAACDTKAQFRDLNNSLGARAATVAFTSRPSRPATREDYESLMQRYRRLQDFYEDLEEEKEKLKKWNQGLKRDRDQAEDLNKQLFREKEKYRVQNASLKDDIFGYKSTYGYIVRQCILPYANKHNLPYSNSPSGDLDRVLQPLLKDAMEAGELREQLQLLQAGMLANVEKVESVSDEQFRRDFGALASSIKSFSRTIKISVGTDLINIDTILQSVLVHNVQSRYWTTGPRKKSMIEAFIWSALIMTVFQSPFHMVGNISNPLAQEFNDLFYEAGVDHHDEWPVPSELAERWRYTTAERLVNFASSEDIVSGTTQNGNEALAKSMAELRNNFCKSIKSTFEALSPNTDFSPLNAIINKAVSLGLQMSLQRSRVQIVWPTIGERFAVGETPHLKSILESEEVEDGSVAFIVNPGLTKWGDAHGKNLKHRYDLVPSTVFIEALDDKEQISDNGGVAILIEALDMSMELEPALNVGGTGLDTSEE
jgi:hypothetical protein